MKKQILSFMTVILLTMSVCITAFAEGDIGTEPVPRDGTAAELKSYGAIVYQKGSDSIKIDSEDLYILADQIDQVKLQVTDQLEALNTYFTAGEGEISLNTSDDISVVHAKPFEEDFVDPLGVNFDTLLEGIAVSQSVSTDAAAYGYPAGTELYKTANGSLTTNGSGAGTEKINVAAATADNLSAGTAAWVNGSLILGTGGDNKGYHDSGYNNGYNSGYNSGYSAGKAAGQPKITQEIRIDQDDTHGFDLYIGSQEYIIVVGTDRLSTDPAPVWRYDGTNFSLLRYSGSAGFVHIPYLHSPSGRATMMYYLNF